MTMPGTMNQPLKLSFITANYIARVHHYDGKEDWGYHDNATVETTTPAVFDVIARDIAHLGFDTIDLWIGHCHPTRHTADHWRAVRDACERHGLAIASIAGGLPVSSRDEAVSLISMMKTVGTDTFGGGYWGAGPDTALPLAQELFSAAGFKYAFENHPEKNTAEVMAKFGGGRFPAIGVALDTGWCGTQGWDAVSAMNDLKPHLLAVHLKDVKAAGRHDTCTLGEGVVPVEAVVKALVRMGFKGTVGIEHEPYDHDPTADIAESLRRVKAWAASA